MAARACGRVGRTQPELPGEKGAAIREAARLESNSENEPQNFLITSAAGFFPLANRVDLSAPQVEFISRIILKILLSSHRNNFPRVFRDRGGRWWAGAAAPRCDATRLERASAAAFSPLQITRIAAAMAGNLVRVSRPARRPESRATRVRAKAADLHCCARAREA